MKKILFTILLGLLFVPIISLAQTTNSNDSEELSPIEMPEATFYQGKVIKLEESNSKEIDGGYIEKSQNYTVKITSGDEKDKEISIKHTFIDNNDQLPYQKIGQKVVISKTQFIDGNINYAFADNYRLPGIIFVFIIFVSLVLWFGRIKGFGSLFGLIFSILVLRFFIVPQIANGANPLMITVIGSLIIISVSLYLAHGFNQRTNLSMISTLITLAISIGLGDLFVNISSLFGQGTEDSMFLLSAGLGDINLKGLLLAGIIIGTLGVLDDITTAQTSVVGELKLANPNLSKEELKKRALIVGKEHISSLVNTLVLAYAGASLPLFLLFSAYPNTPFWYIINTQFIAEEIVRTLVGSISLILAVPISTYIAAHFLSKNKNI